MSTVPVFLQALVDDAAVFPPGNAPLDEAVSAHLRHRASSYADLVGPLVVGDQHLPHLGVVRDEKQQERAPGAAFRHGLPVAVVVSGGAGAVEPAVRWAVKAGVELAGLEVAIRESDAGELAPNAGRLVASIDALVSSGELDDETQVFLETPRLYDAAPSASWLAALDEVAAADHGLKLRTGGLDAHAFPSSTELATCIGAALDRELRFKCTAGLHRALRHRDAAGLEHHGFLNVLLATRASLDGAGTDEVAAVLDETDADALLARTDESGLASAHRWFISFGSCSVAEPLADLRALALVPR